MESVLSAPARSRLLEVILPCLSSSVVSVRPRGHFLGCKRETGRRWNAQDSRGPGCHLKSSQPSGLLTAAFLVDASVASSSFVLSVTHALGDSFGQTAVVKVCELPSDTWLVSRCSNGLRASGRRGTWYPVATAPLPEGEGGAFPGRGGSRRPPTRDPVWMEFNSSKFTCL